MAKENLEISEGSYPKRLIEIVTGYEARIQFKPPIRKQDSRIWLKNGEVPPAVLCPNPVAQIPIPNGQILTGKFYADVVMPEVKRLYLKRRPKTGTRGLKILYDNARPHKSLAVRQRIKEMRLHEVPHPPYSPDIAPCDSWLLENSKITSPDANLGDRLSLGRVIYRYLEAIPKDEYRKTLENWIKRLNSVVAYKGGYSEHS
ncbi:Transposase [Oopsacas minuta]|uniref:Transposase n=1 Tax=Oopsacas minuta TaxID=111878 RepID=A0AAV7KE69_9METZ|nr:Transposase [Oopsacas minuta]